MREFNEIYSELKLYSAFIKEPSTQSQVISSTNVFFTEISDDLGLDPFSSEYDFLVKSYRHTASQFIMNFQTETRSFEQFLNMMYDNLQVKDAA